jgi:hypothetical protein
MEDTAQYEYAIIVNTNDYTGNFEREFCAFTTGAIGECGVGDEERDRYISWAREMGINPDLLADYTASISDDDGCSRPVAIHDDTGEGYHDLIIYLDRPLPADLWDIFKTRSTMFSNSTGWKLLKIKGMRMIKRTIVITDEVITPE